MTSVAITHEGVLDFGKVEGWLGSLLATQSESIYRMKGILSLSRGEVRPTLPLLPSLPRARSRCDSRHWVSVTLLW